MSELNSLKSTPDWFTKSSIYQINPRTFSEAGTLKSIEEELPFLADLGFKIIYLCPIFKADDTLEGRSPRQLASKTENPKNPYRMNDFFEIDEEYGSMDDLKSLIAEAHRLKLKVMLDLVYLHIGPNADILKKHPEFAMHDEQGNVILTKWNFPQLNYENAGLREYLWCNMTYYVGVLDVDGFRCDVGDLVPLDFWIEGKRRIRAINPDAVLLNEGSDWTYLEKCFDASYAFKWHSAIYKIISGNASAQLLREVNNEISGRIPHGAILMRDMDNHDTVTDWPMRAETVAGHDGMELIAALNFTIDGIPMVYCGNELGDSVRLSMFANRFYMGDFEVTDRSKKNEPYSIRRQTVIKALNSLRSKYDALCFGNTEWKDTDDNERLICFERFLDSEKIIFIGNFSNDEAQTKFSPQKYEVLAQSLVPPTVSDGKINLKAYGYSIFKTKETIR
ncbi:MAG: hypothetical protein IKL59_00110 [Clostridia bacterium]|nr:hypothetical protein [Clostridia bacterium]